MNAQHTPGPWLIEDPLGCDAGDHLWIVQEGASPEVYDWRNLAVVCSDDPEDSENARPITVAERNANACLIAAAPQLLTQLEFAVKLLSAFPAVSGTAQVGSMRDTIAKARGFLTLGEFAAISATQPGEKA